MRTKRITDCDSALDLAEMEWWNANATTIEKIWAQNIHFQKIVRLPYLKKMRAFLLKNAKNGKATVLEVGCGSGWVGRLIADEQLHIIGTDFSREQLDIAEKNAKASGKQKYCKYDLADASNFDGRNIDGVLIHALLHHLTVKELETFFKQLSKLASGTKVFIYEPVFFRKREQQPSLYDKVLNRMIYSVRQYSLRMAKKYGAGDHALIKAMDDINAAAEQNGWYISPKEIPFYEGELEKYLEPLCSLQTKFIVNKTDLDIAQALSMSGIVKPPFLFSRILIPIAAMLDKLSFFGNFTQYTYPQQHLFVCFEFIKK
jgi:ubiquinone/menaquinone biosynthesis C-methylase UbiE